MYPVLFHLGPLKLYSFGLMVVLAFLSGAWITVKELRRKQLKPDNMDTYPLLALLAGSWEHGSTSSSPTTTSCCETPCTP